MINFDRSLGFIIHDTARLLRLVFDRNVRLVGLTRAQWFVLGHIIRTNGQTQTNLANETDMDKAPLGKLVDRLEEGGWVERRPDPDDRRANRIFKTAKVDPLTVKMQTTTRELYEVAFCGLDEEERNHLIDQLILIKHNLSAELGRVKH
ncbi:MAG: MarR family transcriptional regulator [Fimbriimonadaceae bacterium]|nr:MarR family transcriptional regulator [Alphaproteobacteria bacterium]